MEDEIMLSENEILKIVNKLEVKSRLARKHGWKYMIFQHNLKKSLKGRIALKFHKRWYKNSLSCNWEVLNLNEYLTKKISRCSEFYGKRTYANYLIGCIQDPTTHQAKRVLKKLLVK